MIASCGFPLRRVRAAIGEDVNGVRVITTLLYSWEEGVCNSRCDFVCVLFWVVKEILDAVAVGINESPPRAALLVEGVE